MVIVGRQGWADWRSSALSSYSLLPRDRNHWRGAAKRTRRPTLDRRASDVTLVAHLKYNHLYYFGVVAKTGSIARAVEALFVTPQTVSGQLRTLISLAVCRGCRSYCAMACKQL